MRLTRFAGPMLVGTGHFLPGPPVPTHELGFTHPDELVRLTGVRTRHVALSSLATSDLLVAACRDLAEAHRDTIDRLLVATVTPDHPSPATAPLVQHALGLERIPSLDIAAACAGFVYAIDVAARAVLTGDRSVLIGAGECRVRTLVDAAEGVRVLFGDGASAALVSSAELCPGPGRGLTPRLRLVATCLGADGRHHGAIRVPAGGSRLPASAETLARGQHALTMEDGPHVFYQAVEGFLQIAHATLRPLGLEPADIDLVVPHQPNLRILERVARLLRLPLDRFEVVVDTIGNVGGASVGIALHHAFTTGRIQPGMRVLLLTAGAGYTAGAALFEAVP